MKITAALIGIIISLWNFHSFASASLPNAKIVNYVFGRFDYSFFLIIPDNLSEYEYLSHQPFTSFMFLNYYNEEKIGNLTVKELKTGNLASVDSCCVNNGFYDVLKLEKLKGFEETAEFLNRSNEFDIAENKNEILSELIELYKKYEDDFKRYLEGFGGTYSFRKSVLRYSNWKKLKDYNEKVEINEPGSRSYYERIDINDYDFDNQLFTIEPLSPNSGRGSKGWEYHYIKKFKKKYGRPEYLNKPDLYNIDFPEQIQVPLKFEDARKIFSKKENVFCETLVTVVPDKGAFGYQGNAFFIRALNFNIVKITKNYYKRKNWSDKEQKFVGDPELSIELESEEKRPLY